MSNGNDYYIYPSQENEMFLDDLYDHQRIPAWNEHCEESSCATDRILSPSESSALSVISLVPLNDSGCRTSLMYPVNQYYLNHQPTGCDVFMNNGGEPKELSPYHGIPKIAPVGYERMLWRNNQISCGPMPTFMNQQVVEEKHEPEMERRRKHCKQSREDHCVFCYNNGVDINSCRTHTVKDRNGRVICPVLRQYICPICHETGDSAHTVRYCPRRMFELR